MLCAQSAAGCARWLGCIICSERSVGVCKLANLLHQSALFRSSCEQIMRNGKVVPYHPTISVGTAHTWQLCCIVELDQSKVDTLLHDNCHDNLILSTKDFQQLQEIVNIVEPFAESTDMTQGDKMVTISCVVPIVLSLNKRLQSSVSASILASFAADLHNSLRSCFY